MLWEIQNKGGLIELDSLEQYISLFWLIDIKKLVRKCGVPLWALVLIQWPLKHLMNSARVWPSSQHSSVFCTIMTVLLALDIKEM